MQACQVRFPNVRNDHVQVESPHVLDTVGGPRVLNTNESPVQLIQRIQQCFVAAVHPLSVMVGVPLLLLTAPILLVILLEHSICDVFKNSARAVISCVELARLTSK